jgi:hypothetical protein
MLKRYTNALLDAIRGAGSNPNDFTGIDDPKESFGFVITFEPAELEFMVSHEPENPHWFWYSFTRYTGANPVVAGPFPDSGSCQFDDVLSAFGNWLAGDVQTSIEEQLIPDLWAQLTETAISPRGEDAEENFSSEQRQQIRAALKTFQVLVEETFDPSELQGELITEHLDYLSEAVDRLNRFDWKSVAISTLVTISVALSLDTERGRQLYGLFQQAFAMLMHLLR